MAKVQFYPLDIAYKIENDLPVIYLYGRTVDNEQICVIDRSFRPYFWIILEDKSDIEQFREKVVKLDIEHKSTQAKVTSTEIVSKKKFGVEVQAVKVYTNLPYSVPVIREVVKEWDMVKEVLEADVLFVRRYLIDKGITPLTLSQAEGELINQRSRVPVFEVEKIEPISGESIKNPRILAIDIETYNPEGSRPAPEKNPIIMLGLYGQDLKKVITWKHFQTDLEYVEFVNSEAELIARFRELIDTYKPDILVGYFSDGFDLPYIKTRADKYKVSLDIGLDHSGIKLGKGASSSASITGIVHLDIYKFVRGVISRSLDADSYTLDKVSEQLLGHKKHDVDIENLADVWDNKADALGSYCEYNLQDAALAFQLCEKLFAHMEELVKIVGLPLFDVSRMSFSQLVEWFILKQSPNFNELAPNKPHYNQIKERKMQTYMGAFVFEPKPGLYKNIAVFDFRSLYPSIIVSHNIAPSTLNCTCCEEDGDYAPESNNWFCKKKRGFISLILEDIITRRMRIKEMKGESTLLEARSESLKLLANSFYGYLGFFAARWYSIECARAVTAYGRHYIHKVIGEAEGSGYKVLYSDTDSIFMSLEKKSEDEAKGFVESFNESLPKMMELEYEGLYPAGLFVASKASDTGAKKKYAMLRNDNTLKIRGFEAIRRNWSPVAKEVQEKVLNILLKEDDKEKALKYIKDVVADLRKKKVSKDKVIIHTQLQRDLDSYTAIGPHVAVARKMKADGQEVGAGSTIKYIITQGDGIIRDRAKLPEEVKEDGYDAEYYINNQVIPAVDKIMGVFGYSKADLEGKGQKKLDKFF